jgi:hypothetical protein
VYIPGARWVATPLLLLLLLLRQAWRVQSDHAALCLGKVFTMCVAKERHPCICSCQI